jgi:hypothetical protein
VPCGVFNHRKYLVPCTKRDPLRLDCLRKMA